MHAGRKDNFFMEAATIDPAKVVGINKLLSKIDRDITRVSELENRIDSVWKLLAAYVPKLEIRGLQEYLSWNQSMANNFERLI